jgi:hypothetical protein
MNPSHFLFIYRSKTHPVRFEAARIDECFQYPERDWEHTATICPELWIQSLLNTPTDEINAYIAKIQKPQT